ncbi:MAG: ankyrin repeat domain-containing protein [Rhabdochlamydiaceae bacterium]|nr:ankyrin repeat domain-containing protein [Rhabdochlamydiaceae bacterium]
MSINTSDLIQGLSSSLTPSFLIGSDLSLGLPSSLPSPALRPDQSLREEVGSTEGRISTPGWGAFLDGFPCLTPDYPSTSGGSIGSVSSLSDGLAPSSVLDYILQRLEAPAESVVIDPIWLDRLSKALSGISLNRLFTFDPKGPESILSLAARKGQLEIVQLLLEYAKNSVQTRISNGEATLDKIEPVWRTPIGLLPLYQAVLGGKKAVLSALIDYAKETNVLEQIINKSEQASNRWGNPDQYTPFHKACDDGNADCIAVLLEAYEALSPRLPITVLSEKTPRGYFPFLMAVRSENQEAVNFFIEYARTKGITSQMISQISGYSPESYTTALCAACEADGNSEKRKTLVETILNVCNRFNDKTKYLLQFESPSISPLFGAVRNRNEEAVDLLISFAKKLNILDKLLLQPNDVWKWLALHAACSDGSVRLIQTLLENHPQSGPFPLEIPTRDLYYPLFLAIESQNPDAVLAIINYAKKSGTLETLLRQKNGPSEHSAFHFACLLGSTEIIKIFLDHDTGISLLQTPAKGYGCPLLLTVRSGKEDAVRAIINHAKKENKLHLILDTLDFEKRATAMYYACCLDNLSIATILLQHGASMNKGVYPTIPILVLKEKPKMAEGLLSGLAMEQELEDLLGTADEGFEMSLKKLKRSTEKSNLGEFFLCLNKELSIYILMPYLSRSSMQGKDFSKLFKVIQTGKPLEKQLEFFRKASKTLERDSKIIFQDCFYVAQEISNLIMCAKGIFTGFALIQSKKTLENIKAGFMQIAMENADSADRILIQSMAPASSSSTASSPSSSSSWASSAGRGSPTPNSPSSSGPSTSSLARGNSAARSSSSSSPLTSSPLRGSSMASSSSTSGRGRGSSAASSPSSSSLSITSPARGTSPASSPSSSSLSISSPAGGSSGMSSAESIDVDSISVTSPGASSKKRATTETPRGRQGRGRGQKSARG